MAILMWGIGINQKDLADKINDIRTKWNAALAALDLDGGGGEIDTDYASLHSISDPGISGRGIDQGRLVDFIKEAYTDMNAACDKMTTDTDLGSYAAFKKTQPCDSSSAGNIYQHGINQSGVIAALNELITQINLIFVDLTAEGKTSTTYTATYAITDTINETGTSYSK